MTTGRDTPAPEEALTATDDDDNQLVEGADEVDIRNLTDGSNDCDASCPTMVHCRDPELGELPVRTEVTIGALNDTNMEIDPELPKDETMTGTDVPTEDTIFATKFESEDH
jgi:hypothetical protein